MIEPYILHIFILNLLLVFCDASLAYHLAPLLGRGGAKDGEEAERAARGMRKLLSFVVALYTLLNCMAYADGSPVFLLIVTAVIILDMIGQLLLRRKLLRKMCD